MLVLQEQPAEIIGRQPACCIAGRDVLSLQAHVVHAAEERGGVVSAQLELILVVAVLEDLADALP